MAHRVQYWYSMISTRDLDLSSCFPVAFSDPCILSSRLPPFIHVLRHIPNPLALDYISQKPPGWALTWRPCDPARIGLKSQDAGLLPCSSTDYGGTALSGGVGDRGMNSQPTLDREGSWGGLNSPGPGALLFHGVAGSRPLLIPLSKRGSLWRGL